MKKFTALLAAVALLFSSVADAAIINSLPYNLTNGSLADATQVMANYNQIVNNVNTNAAHNGANNDITSLTGLTTPLAPTYGGTPIYTGGTTAGTANAQTLASVTPSAFALTAGNIVTGIAGNTNTGATTLQVNGQTATAVEKRSSTGLLALAGGEIVSGSAYVFYYDGTQFELVNPSVDQFTTEATLASAASTDLGTAASHIIDITGTTTITSFGSSATAADPLYFGRFTGILTLTYNATSLILPGAANITTAAGDTFTAKYEGSGNWRVVSYTPASGLSVVPGVIKVDAQNFTTGGTYTPCAGLLYADAKLLGGGGGGGGSANQYSAGGGGAAGALSEAVLTAVQIGASQTITIGAGGTAGANTGGTGGTGGTTSVGSLLTAPGGTGGTGDSTNSSAAGGAGATGSLYGASITSAPGGPKMATGNNSSGYGGNTFIGGGAQAAGTTESAGAGSAGAANTGGGGSGGSSSTSSTAELGGVGGSGIAIITEYCN